MPTDFEYYANRFADRANDEIITVYMDIMFGATGGKINRLEQQFEERIKILEESFNKILSERDRFDLGTFLLDTALDLFMVGAGKFIGSQISKVFAKYFSDKNERHSFSKIVHSRSNLSPDITVLANHKYLGPVKINYRSDIQRLNSFLSSAGIGLDQIMDEQTENKFSKVFNPYTEQVGNKSTGEIKSFLLNTHAQRAKAENYKGENTKKFTSLRQLRDTIRFSIYDFVDTQKAIYSNTEDPTLKEEEIVWKIFYKSMNVKFLNTFFTEVFNNYKLIMFSGSTIYRLLLKQRLEDFGPAGMTQSSCNRSLIKKSYTSTLNAGILKDFNVFDPLPIVQRKVLRSLAINGIPQLPLLKNYISLKPVDHIKIDEQVINFGTSNLIRAKGLPSGADDLIKLAFTQYYYILINCIVGYIPEFGKNRLFLFLEVEEGGVDKIAGRIVMDHHGSQHDHGPSALDDINQQNNWGLPFYTRSPAYILVHEIKLSMKSKISKKYGHKKREIFKKEQTIEYKKQAKEKTIKHLKSRKYVSFTYGNSSKKGIPIIPTSKLIQAPSRKLLEWQWDGTYKVNTKVDLGLVQE